MNGSNGRAPPRDAEWLERLLDDPTLERNAFGDAHGGYGELEAEVAIASVSVTERRSFPSGSSHS